MDEIKNKLLARAKETNSDNLLIYKSGKQILKYGKTKNPIEIMSCTKSIIALLFGILSDNHGLDIHDYVFNYLPPDLSNKYGWTKSPKNKITIYHILTQSSGLDNKWPLPGNTTMKAMMATALALKQKTKLNTFAYNNVAVVILCQIIEFMSGQDVVSFAKDKLFSPMGIKNFKWVGNNLASYGLCLTSEDFMKIGKLVLNNGKFSRKQIISKKWVKLMLSPSKADKNYGLLWWISNINGQTVYHANGWGGQYLLIYPKTNIIVVRQIDVNGRIGNKKYADMENKLSKLDIKVNGYSLLWLYTFSDLYDLAGTL
jgi:CubicO group peptidase (beta-lactamase class C family)